MAEQKRYFWLKLYDDFFGSLRIKKLRKMAGGDTFVIIYLKMQLKAMKTDGIIAFRGIEQDIVEELALDLDEEPDNVRITLAYLCSCGLAETSDQTNFFFPYAVQNTGSEGSSAERVRRYRDNKALRSNADVTHTKRLSNGEIEKEKDTEIEKDVKRFKPPTLEEVQAYCDERHNSVDAKAFFDYYNAGKWKDSKGKPVRNWKQKVITWERTTNEKKPETQVQKKKRLMEESAKETTVSFEQLESLKNLI